MSEHRKPFPHEYPEDEYFGQATMGKVGMWVFLLSDALMFAGFLLGYGILRGSADVWWPANEPELGIPFTACLTFLLICSSVTMVLAYAAAVEKDKKNTLLFLGLTILGGVLFLCGQYKEYFGFEMIGKMVHWHWLEMGLTDEGLNWGESARANTFYVITSFHGFHVFSGVCYLTVTWIRTWLGHFDDGNYNEIEIVGLFWHFVDLIWILVFTFVYLL